MSKLVCSVDNCVFNEKGCCSRSEIMVGGMDAIANAETRCNSYKERTHVSIQSSMNFKPDPSLQIRCEAEHCIYNDNYICKAGYIHIDRNYENRDFTSQCDSFDNQLNGFYY